METSHTDYLSSAFLSSTEGKTCERQRKHQPSSLRRRGNNLRLCSEEAALQDHGQPIVAGSSPDRQCDWVGSISRSWSHQNVELLTEEVSRPAVARTRFARRARRRMTSTAAEFGLVPRPRASANQFRNVLVATCFVSSYSAFRTPVLHVPHWLSF